MANLGKWGGTLLRPIRRRGEKYKTFIKTWVRVRWGFSCRTSDPSAA